MRLFRTVGHRVLYTKCPGELRLLFYIVVSIYNLLSVPSGVIYVLPYQEIICDIYCNFLLGHIHHNMYLWNIGFDYYCMFALLISQIHLQIFYYHQL